MVLFLYSRKFIGIGGRVSNPEKILEKKSNEEILEEYNKNLFKKDKISVFEIDGLRQNGIIKSCDEQGFLWIDLENSELQKFYHKEIEMLY